MRTNLFCVPLPGDLEIILPLGDQTDNCGGAIACAPNVTYYGMFPDEEFKLFKVTIPDSSDDWGFCMTSACSISAFAYFGVDMTDCPVAGYFLTPAGINFAGQTAGTTLYFLIFTSSSLAPGACVKWLFARGGGSTCPVLS